jgi:LPXTG-site transpeptidase (sortase) family protein
MNDYPYQNAPRRGRSTWLRSLLLVAGAALCLVGALVAPSYVRGDRVFNPELITKRVEGWFGRRPNTAGSITDEGLRVRVEAPVAFVPPPEQTVVGKLSIPRLGVYATIREGTTRATSGQAVGHITGTALPGQNGTVGIAGQHDPALGRLSEIAPSDEIRIQTDDSVYLYKVDNATSLKPDETLVVRTGAYPGMTLLADVPGDRFVVRARQVAQIPLVDAASASPAPPAQTEPPAPSRGIQTFPQQRSDTGTAEPQRRIAFEVDRNRSRELAPGISIGLTSTDPNRETVDAWLWLMPDKRAVWLRDQKAGSPVAFETSGRPSQWRLVVTQVTPGSMRGYLMSQ